MTSSGDEQSPHLPPMRRLLLCTDLDRTLLPNGELPESEGARAMLARVLRQSGFSLAYVSGRHLALIEQSIRDYDLPQPDWIIGDVGSSIHVRDGDGWSLLDAWSRYIAADWQGCSAGQLGALLGGCPGLVLQPEDRQNAHKLSFFLSPLADLPALTRAIHACLEPLAIATTLIFSNDESARVGLLDVLPQRAGKLHAVEFLMREQGFSAEQTLYAGDSGNDLCVLTSGLPAVLVANAHPDVAEQAVRESARKGTSEFLYLARGGFLGMNGNYSAGILEGIGHFHAEAIPELD
ncbi:HAD-IIB family hydrolase [Synechococcus sp. FACHB-909]|uniref:HAD-IIB family hydrolase n=1 Tax=Synechococcus sp. FACHB-909 TaxID=2692863 RepID=UPI002570C5EB|nr:HAD-IIB family hydrolase [Synechococcus sp. FACHB-909]